ncbi:MAG: bifunctional histidine phosphatase family protein/GNAT family N-acetyltransferase [Eubacteriales bacterium]|nr:bifunctional histidine phosphatase family protein/GNAT family N-acetyltransferase [Eubacteriales bacterium]
MTEIYLIRHTQAEGNLYRITQGHWDGDVTPLGLKEIDALAERFRGFGIDAVYSSDLYRAVLTARALTKYNDLEVITDERLRELDVGSWEGQFFCNMMYEKPELTERFLTSPWNWKVEGSETLSMVADRAVEAVNELAEKHSGEKIAIVSHGVTIRCLLTRLLGLPLEGEGIAPIVKNTAVCKLICENGEYRADYLNDVSHLGGLPVSDWVQRDGIRHELFDPASDPEYYKKCYRDAWKFAHNGSLSGYSEETYYHAARKHYSACRDSVLKFYSGDQPAGLADFDIERGKHAGYGWISLLYLEPEFRFQGYGIQALGRAIMLYNRLGRKSVRLNVAASNTAAVRFYEKCGFRHLSAEPGSDGPLYLMERFLGRIS